MTDRFIYNGGDGTNGEFDPTTTNDWSGAYATAIAASTASVDGDTLVVNHLHYEISSANYLLYLKNNVTFISVLNTDTTVFQQGAEIETSGNTYIGLMASTVGVKVRVLGVNFIVNGSFRVSGSVEQAAEISDCTFTFNISGKSISITHDGAKVTFTNVEFTNYINNVLTCGNGSLVIFDDIQMSGASSANFFGIGSGNGGTTIVIKNSDLITLGGNSMSRNVGGSHNDVCSYFFINNKLASGATLYDGNFLQKGSSIVGRSLSFGNSVGNTYFEQATYTGNVVESLAIYRSDINENSNGFSAELKTNTNTNLNATTEFELKNIPIDTTDYSGTITFKVNLARNSGVLLKESEVYILVTYTDGETLAFGMDLTTRYFDRSAGANITNETGGWTGLTGVEGTDHQVMSISTDPITIGALTGNIASGIVTVSIGCGLTDDTIYVCGDVEIS